MKIDVTLDMFIRAFKESHTYKDNFTTEGLDHLYHYLTCLENETERDMKLDVVGICCEYSEYKNTAEVVEAFSIDVEDVEDVDLDAHVENYLSDNTSVVCYEQDCIIIADF